MGVPEWNTFMLRVEGYCKMPSIKDDFKRWTTDVNPTHEKVLAGKLAKLGPKDHGSGWGAFWFIHIVSITLSIDCVLRICI